MKKLSMLNSARPKQQGVAAVEFALISVLLLTLLLGASEFGRAMYLYNSAVKGTRSAARYLSNYPPADVGSTDRATQLQAARSIAFGTTGIDIVPGLTGGTITVRDAKTNPTTYSAIKIPGTSGTASTVDKVEVEISGLTFNFLTSGLLPVTTITFGPIRAIMTRGAS